MPDGLEFQFCDGLASRLDTAGIATYNASGVYAAGDIGIVFGGLAQDPTQQIALTTYSVQDDPVLNDSILGVQVMLRGTADPFSVKNLSGSIFDQFQGLTNVWFGDLYLALLWRQSGRLDGQDDLNRWLSVENYYARVNWPTANRTE